jgi:DNA gyrase subunit A
MEVGLVNKIDIDQQMQQSYLDYAMSVIVARALPDARDGLKPVHRRILYAMHDMGLRSDSAYKKSARIVGEVLGKYHPHGDMAVYDSMARMAQDFSMRYLLVDGQGNFGSVDGDPPAAMRYTEARLAAPATTILTDIGKNTVDFTDNFDGTLKEPSVLPSALPNLLVNGASGIAVGMATNIPPHNLGEVIDALRFMLENWEKLDDISMDDLMHFIQGPDFPTGGVIFHERGAEDEGLRSAYGTGRGRITVQARAHLEEMERGKNRIIVTELPYLTNKSSLIERIAELVREGKLEGIADLRDESDRQGMRIVIELTKNVEPETVLRDLYKHTPMQSTFGIIMLALVGGEPRMLSLKAALRVYVEHRLEIVKRRSEYDLEKARARAHILEGLRIALRNLDEVIDLIRKATDADTAKTRLMKRFKLSEIQAQAILDMPLRRLAALERKKIEDEYKEVLAQIKELEGLLHSAKKMRLVVSDELLAVKEAFSDRRRTQIISMKASDEKFSLLTAHDQMLEKVTWISLTTEGLLSRTLDEKEPRLSGKSAPTFLLEGYTKDTLFLISQTGEGAAIAVHTLLETDDSANGVPFWKISPLSESDEIAVMFTLPTKERPEGHFIFTTTKLGMVKKSALIDLPGPSATTFTLVKVNPGDRLISTLVTDGLKEILLATANGMAIRFKENDVRPMGLIAAGVAAIKLKAGDEVIGSECIKSSYDAFLIAINGHAKRVPVNEFPVQSRYGQGVQAWKLTRQTQLVGLAIGKGTNQIIVQLNRLAPKSVRLDEAPLQTRQTQGKNILELKPGDYIIGINQPRRLSDSKTLDESKESKRSRRSGKSLSIRGVKNITQDGEPEMIDKQDKLPEADIFVEKITPSKRKSTPRIAEPLILAIAQKETISKIPETTPEESKSVKRRTTKKVIEPSKPETILKASKTMIPVTPARKTKTVKRKTTSNTSKASPPVTPPKETKSSKVSTTKTPTNKTKASKPQITTKILKPSTTKTPINKTKTTRASPPVTSVKETKTSKPKTTSKTSQASTKSTSKTQGNGKVTKPSTATKPSTKETRKRRTTPVKKVVGNDEKKGTG